MPLRLRSLFMPKNLPRLVIVIAIFLLVRAWLFGSSKNERQEEEASPETPLHRSNKEGQKYLVVASMKGDDVSWLYDFFPDWKKAVYVMNDPYAPLTVAHNVGRESTAYLTYLIDNYDNLPDYMVFLHALRYQWHNEDPMYDGVPPLRHLRLSHVNYHGYANMRCTHTIGCPVEMRPYDALMQQRREIELRDDRDQTEAAYAQAFLEIFPDTTMEDIPREVGIQCGAQFALARWKVLERPRADYVRYREWLWSTHLPDSVSGRILEYAWHMIMGKSAVHCPDAAMCFCEKFGLCDLKCPDEGHCEKRYHLPQYATIPKDWPDVGPGRDGWPAVGWWH